MFLSVIIPTRNRARYLASALESLTRQTYPHELYEVIVVDNGSADNTRDACKRFTPHIKKLRYFYDPAPGLHVGRHLGMRHAESDILVYTDDDIEAFPTWLEGIAKTFSDPKVVLVGGKNLPKWEADPPNWVLKMWEKDKKGDRILGYLSILDLGEEKKQINPHRVFGCNFSIRKSILLEAGGFHPDAMPHRLIQYRGDGETHVSEFIKKMGLKAIYNPKASVFHIVPKEKLTEEYFCNRAYLQGISDSYTRLRKHFSFEKASLTQQIIWYLRFRRKKWRLYLDGRKRIFGHEYYKGNIFHKNAVKFNKSLYYWVIKEQYMDESNFKVLFRIP